MHDEPLYDTTGAEALSGNVLVAQTLRKEFGGLVAVNDVDFTVPRGQGRSR